MSDRLRQLLAQMGELADEVAAAIEAQQSKMVFEVKGKRAEQYFCPIKHARRVRGTHAHSARFLEFGDAVDHEKKLEHFRIDLGRLP